jgi:subtilisin family serine protease
MNMQQNQLGQWIKSTNAVCQISVAPLLFGVIALVAGCNDLEESNDIDPNDIELRNHDQTETGGVEAEEDQPVPGVIPGQYIVMMKKGANPHAAAAAVQAIPEHVYTHAISGFAGPLNAGQLEALSHRNDVMLIEPDGVVTAAETECPPNLPDATIQYKLGAPYWSPAYSIDRTDQRYLPFSNTYSYIANGTGVNAYVFDTPMDTENMDFNGRASEGYDGYPNDSAVCGNCSGHATHVAGLIGGELYGMAKGVNLISVKVLNCDGHGSWSRLIAGMDWVMDHRENTPAVANMSLSGRKSMTVNHAIDNFAESGVFVVVAAGNSNSNACKYSPAGANNAFTVAANNSNDQRASFSNYGPCVELYAGGTNVRSDWLCNTTATASGTSMSTPVVAGVGALYKDMFGDTPWDQMKADLQNWATPDIITGNPPNTPNSQVYWPCSGSGM